MQNCKIRRYCPVSQAQCAVGHYRRKTNQYEVGKSIRQGLDYARLLDVAFIFASNGDGFIFHKKTAPAEAS